MHNGMRVNSRRQAPARWPGSQLVSQLWTNRAWPAEQGLAWPAGLAARTANVRGVWLQAVPRRRQLGHQRRQPLAPGQRRVARVLQQRAAAIRHVDLLQRCRHLGGRAG